MKKTTMGLIGAGSMGRIHAENIMTVIPEIELKYVSDPYPDQYNKMANRYSWPIAIEDYKKIIEDPEVDAIIIAAPAALHGDMIIEAANKGKHVYCEKPVDYSIEKSVLAIKACKKNNVKLQLGFNRRFDSNFAKARKYVDSGNIGDVHLITITSRDPIPPAMSYFTAPGGEHCSIYTDTTIHDFDMARFLNNSEVKEVYAMGSKLINKDKPEITRDDTCVVTLRFEDDSLAVINNSWEAVYGYDQRAEVFGTKGSATVENNIFSQTTLNSKEGIIGENPLVTIKDRYGEAYADEIRAFVKSIQENTEPLVTGKDGLISLVIANAARKSAEENRPILISEIMPGL
ncbi:inositol 2-dehydrogenase [Globicatella sulfidifaciens]|uniref:Inositol 2-dehydrogenase n=1 Tax=Globicatella sulfidifaciens TaxID=136093 RepID=A0A7X8C555_9LACT|nr:inositol 2-dehydrogenase [Globicatella sulfidifaciens]NLJ19131.1 inositol 2-dehydrogenase [Globicatella sulfidifaciens]